MKECERFRNWCQERLDGTPAPADETLAGHPAACPDCQAFQDCLALVHRSLQTHLPQGDGPPLPQGLAHPPGSRAWPWLIGGIGGALLILALVASLLGRHSPSPPAAPATSPGPGQATPSIFFLRQESPAVFLRQEDAAPERPAPSTGESPLGNGCLIRCDAHGKARLTTRDGSSLTLAPSTELAVQGEEVRMKVGEIWVAIRTKGGHFRVFTPTAILGVRGTRFGVTVALDGSTRVRCEEGTVWVKGNAGAGEHLVLAGHQIAVDRTGQSGTLQEWSPDDQPRRTLSGEEFMKNPVRIDKPRR
ncbi:MAG: FecR domain-containing protein [Candidatus Riflebacteria bacterium]|nr:FecR domain-containing protein [Candidatus Riflebacteria bacterium]